MPPRVRPAFIVKKVGRLYRSTDGSARGVYVEDLRIPSAGLTMILGRSGSGKSTLLSLLAGFFSHWEESHGRHSELKFRRPDGTFVDLLRRGGGYKTGDLGFVFQEAYLLGNASVGQNALAAAVAAGRKVGASDFEAVLSDLEIAPLLMQRAHTISGGEAQRVAFARALLAQPSAILADEPTSNLDPGLGALLVSYLQDWARTHQRPVVVVTHDYGLAARFADTLVILGRGNVSDVLSVADKGQDDVIGEPPSRASEIQDLVEKAWTESIRFAPGPVRQSGRSHPPARPAVARQTGRTQGGGGSFGRSDGSQPGQARRSESRAGADRPALPLQGLRFLPGLALVEACRGTGAVNKVPGWIVPGARTHRGRGQGGSGWRFMTGYSLKFLTAVLFSCLCLSFLAFYGGSVVRAHFAGQLNEPDVSHVTVGIQRPRSADQRDVIFTDLTLAALQKELEQTVRAERDRSPLEDFLQYLPGDVLQQILLRFGLFQPRQQVDLALYGRRLQRLQFEILPDGVRECGTGGIHAPFDVAVARFREPAYQERAAWRPDSPSERTMLGPLIAEAPKESLIATPRLMQTLWDLGVTGNNGDFLVCPAGLGRPLRVRAVVQTLPGADIVDSEIAMHEAIYREIEANKGFDLGTYNTAAVYFDYEDFRALRTGLEEAGVDVPTDVFDKIASLIRAARDSQIVIAFVGGVVILITLACALLVLYSHVKSNHKAFCVLRAFRFRRRHLFTLLFIQILIAYSIAALAFFIAVHLSLPTIQSVVSDLFPHAKDAALEADILTPLAVIGLCSGLLAGLTTAGWWATTRNVLAELKRT